MMDDGMGWNGYWEKKCREGLAGLRSGDFGTIYVEIRKRYIDFECGLPPMWYRVLTVVCDPVYRGYIRDFRRALRDSAELKGFQSFDYMMIQMRDMMDKEIIVALRKKRKWVVFLNKKLLEDIFG